jgi:hypothetical protein
MAEKGWIGHSTLTAIANAIREKTGDAALLLPGAMAQAIGGISTEAPVYEAEVTVATDSSTLSYAFTHGLGKTPDAFLLFDETFGAGIPSGSQSNCVIFTIYAAGYAIYGKWDSAAGKYVANGAADSMPYGASTFNDTQVSGSVKSYRNHTWKAVIF